jgi:hypothetical protein
MPCHNDDNDNKDTIQIDQDSGQRVRDIRTEAANGFTRTWQRRTSGKVGSRVSIGSKHPISTPSLLVSHAGMVFLSYTKTIEIQGEGDLVIEVDHRISIEAEEVEVAS